MWEVNNNKLIPELSVKDYKEFLIQDPDGYLLRFCEDIGTKKGDK